MFVPFFRLDAKCISSNDAITSTISSTRRFNKRIAAND